MCSRAVSVEDIGAALAPALKKGGAKRAILFGSYARGEASEWSDLDLIIVAESKLPFVERFKGFSGLRQLSPVKAMDILVYTPDEFQRMVEEENSFIAGALAEGRVIYEAASVADNS